VIAAPLGGGTPNLRVWKILKDIAKNSISDRLTKPKLSFPLFTRESIFPGHPRFKISWVNICIFTLLVVQQVVQLLCECTCATQFPMVRIGDGKYRVGDKLVIFVRILRRHIMVRVGGGWQELSEFLRQKDPCRTKHHGSSITNGSMHEQIAANLCSSLGSTGHCKTPINSRIPTICNGSGGFRSSRLLGSNNHLNRGSLSKNHSDTSGQKMISGSVSMSWLSNRS